MIYDFLGSGWGILTGWILIMMLGLWKCFFVARRWALQHGVSVRSGWITVLADVCGFIVGFAAVVMLLNWITDGNRAPGAFAAAEPGAIVIGAFAFMRCVRPTSMALMERLFDVLGFREWRRVQAVIRPALTKHSDTE